MEGGRGSEGRREVVDLGGGDCLAGDCLAGDCLAGDTLEEEVGGKWMGFEENDSKEEEDG